MKYPHGRKTNAEHIDDPLTCPRCGSGNLNFSHIILQDKSAHQDVSCSDCGFLYWDLYELSGYEAMPSEMEAP